MEALGRGVVPMSQRTSEGVARILRTEIFSGRLKPGEPMPERLLAQQLGVSRTPVREALFTLQSEGLVELTPNRGATVRMITAQDIVRIYSLRGVLESYAAREAATAREQHHLDALEDAHARLVRIGTQGTASEQALADLAFHMLITEAAGNPLLQTIMGQVLAFTVSYRSNYAYPDDRATSGGPVRPAPYGGRRDDGAVGRGRSGHRAAADPRAAAGGLRGPARAHRRRGGRRIR